MVAEKCHWISLSLSLPPLLHPINLPEIFGPPTLGSLPRFRLPPTIISLQGVDLVSTRFKSLRIISYKKLKI
ncbi:hypothetical protein Q3G72_010613 [Acer saccharum]|nr:hypothetical protein Q3G72_010613 [Acer saccharum]